MQITRFIVAATWSIAAVAHEPPDAQVHFVGRWDLSDPSRPWCAWQGSSFEASFKGKGITASFESDREEYVRVIVDDDHLGSRKIKIKQGRHEYSLVSDLALAPHTVEVVKETYTGRSRLYLHEVKVDDGEFILVARNEPRLRIQFYGDSNLAGYSLEHEKNQGDASYSGCHFTFAGIVSRMFEAEYQNISVSGAKILGSQNSVMSFFSRMDFYEAQPKWDFSRFPADICVVNIGANNVNRNSKNEIKKDYRTLLLQLRQAHPHAHIVVMNGYGWDRNETANFTQEVVDELADKNMSRVVFPWLFNEWHGCEYDHAGMARVLAEHLETIDPAWKTVREMDVMDGFGRDGNVANGSFEFAAPFGGFGWRYFQDGAFRVHAPKESPDGEWFLRIPEQSEVHQPNPATKSRRYSYRFKLRSPDSGQARIRIEFRDQQYRNEIKDSSQEFHLHPGIEWKEYNVVVRSPDGTGDRSRDVWQIILRVVSDSGTVECDDVRLSIVDNATVEQNL